MSKFKRVGVLVLILGLVFSFGVAVNAESDWEAEDWGEFWGSAARELFFEYASQYSILEVELEELVYISSNTTDPFNGEMEISCNLKIGEQKRYMPADDEYWSLDSYMPVYEYYDSHKPYKRSFLVPSDQSTYQVSVKIWDYDKYGSNDLVDRTIFEYNRIWDTSKIIETQFNNRILISLDFELRSLK